MGEHNLSPGGNVEANIDAFLPQDSKPWWKTPHLLRLNFLLTVPMMTGYLIGFDSSMLNGLQSVPVWNEDFGHPHGVRLGLLGTMQVIGAVASLPICPPIADRFGRRPPVFAGSAVALLGTALQSASTSFDMFLAGRFFVGFGTGLVGIAASPLLAELAYPSHRPFLTSFGSTTWFLGAIVAAWATYGTFKIPNSWSWRIPSLLQAIPSVYQGLLIYFLPESPRWLVSRGKVSEARAVLNKYHAGEQGDSDISPLVRYEMVEIEAAIELEKLQNKRSYLDFFATKGNRHRLIIAVTLGLSAQWAGNALVSFYLVVVLRSMGITDPEQQNLINGGLTIFCYGINIIGSAMVVRVGRRTLLLSGFAGMAATYTVWTILSSLNQQTGFTNGSLGTGVVAMIFVFQFFYNMSIGPVLPTYIMEIMPFTLRAKGYMIEQIFTYGGGLFNGFVTPIAMEAISWRYYIVWIVMLVVWFCLVFIFFPETKGRTLEEVAQLFDGVDVSGNAVAHVREKENHINEVEAV
ncbi:hexose transporter protein (Lactose permease) [Colletotrichum truncatum]|uniref:Hexose transporter protein (Lactose permease) n=1 Tax=Colletotrichum truncatum TaxID=5467 RepID=A0ACC3ZHA6_COLTU|nr:hexose transporter protein (Lactose permease) [Colletotrichum truncatum]KAF6781004.1 hexose transporter protein (Lactose permease) [Colletotrichum truncatum]